MILCSCFNENPCIVHLLLKPILFPPQCLLYPKIFCCVWYMQILFDQLYHSIGRSGISQSPSSYRFNQRFISKECLYAKLLFLSSSVLYFLYPAVAWKCWSAVRHLPSMYKVLSLIPSTANKRNPYILQIHSPPTTLLCTMKS